MEKIARWVWFSVLGMVLTAVGAGGACGAELLDRVRNQELSQVLRLRVGHSKVLRAHFAITRISVADPDVADIVLISEKEIYVNALAPGVTNLSIWGKSRFSSATVTVEADLTLLKEKLHQILPKEKIGVEAANDTVVLSGEVSGPVAQETALSLATPYAGGKREKVINLMHIGGVQQVMVEVRLAEINRTIADRIGVNFMGTGKNAFGVSQINNLNTVSSIAQSITGSVLGNTISPSITAIAGFAAGPTFWAMFFDLLKQQNLGRVLAEPNLVTTSGQKASFLAGGEFPIPVPQSGVGGSATITIEYKKFGVGLEFTPTVLADDKIAMKVHPVVSELDFTTTVAYTTLGFTIPGLKTREMDTHVEVKDGQTFAIAGLLSQNTRDVINKFPILGDIPVLGTLFRSTSYQKNETELVTLVTPHLVKPMAAGGARLPTDKYIEPNDVETYLLGIQQGREEHNPRPPGTVGNVPAAAGLPVRESGVSLPAGFGHQQVQ
jgi:pilus assembly protein CpaC